MKTQNTNNKLAFGKFTIAELQQEELLQINGGGSTILGGETCTGCCCVKTLQTIVDPTVIVAS